MGRSSPPFLYGRPSTYSFQGPTDQPFNPKAATEASRIRVQPRPQPKGPLVDINRHPDSWVNNSFDKSTWTPMNPKTKDRVKYARKTQLGLRITTLLAALCSLFCSVVIKGASVTVIWIIRAGPIVAILHTIYGICHHGRSPVTRPPASQASYGLFAATLDVGLIAFYVFTAFISYGEWNKDAYNWSTLFGNGDVTVKIAEATFICAVVNAGLHLVSFTISIYLAIVFRKIAHLPPDMNPLEDNLTARPRKNRNNKPVAWDEKHMSQSTLNSSMEDPLIEAPRTVQFMHTRDQSLGGETYRGSMDMSEKRQSQASAPAHPHRLSHLEPTSPEMLFQHAEDQPFDITSQTPEFRNVTAHSPEFVNPTQLHHLTSRAADRSDSVSPMSDNWITYSDRGPSPMSDVQNENQNANETTIRQSSSVYSRRTNGTETSTGGGIRDWFAYGQKPASIGSAIQEDTRGEYASLALHEYYGNDDENKSREQDLGDRRFNIFPDPEEHDNDRDDGQADGLPFNPLMLNPPTPQPIFTEHPENTDPIRRSALGDNPNLSQNPMAQAFVPHESPDTTPEKARYYGNLEGEGQVGLSKSRNVSGQDDMNRKPSKLSKKHSKKMAAYQSLKKDDSDDEGHLGVRDPSSPAMYEGDRKGRVVSNSGADTARPSLVGGVGASLSSYGSYIAGLGVGRRRDVSGKVAEEGRGGKSDDERAAPVSQTQSQIQGASTIRAAGWARFAGL